MERARQGNGERGDEINGACPIRALHCIQHVMIWCARVGACAVCGAVQYGATLAGRGRPDETIPCYGTAYTV